MKDRRIIQRGETELQKREQRSFTDSSNLVQFNELTTILHYAALRIITKSYNCRKLRREIGMTFAPFRLPYAHV